ncbi:MAG: PD40 domain-containing protein [Deltaproteobacteria bacterium]|nr:PD40 domain-containing protein [Deltaproteobacteria bacterium]
MTILDTSSQGIVEVAWSNTSDEIVYVKDDNQIFRTKVTEGSKPVFAAKGHYPGFTESGDILFEKDDSIAISKDGNEKIIIKQGEILKGSANRRPSVSPDGKKFVFVIDNIFHKESQSKNAYPYRSFFAGGECSSSPKPKIMAKQQWYGGSVTWMTDGGFLHYEYDSTSGARIHVVDKDGHDIAIMSGLQPSVSPDLKRIACKPKGGQSVVVYLKKGDEWNSEDLEQTVIKLPEGGKLSGSAPIWLDNRFLLIDEGGKLFRVDISKKSAEEMKKLPVPTFRGSRTMTISPDRELIAMEVEREKGFELQIHSLA